MLKKEYIDKGLVRLVFSPFPLDKSSLKAVMLASCASSEKYFDFIVAEAQPFFKKFIDLKK